MALLRKKRGERGFTLIELGIVIAVIAVLSTVVIVGKGFIQQSRVTKLVDAVDVVRKGVSMMSGLAGGRLPPAAGNQLGALRGRGFIPGPAGNNADWVPIPGLAIEDVQWVGGIGAANQIGIQVSCATGQCLDVWNAFGRDPNVVAGGGTIGTLAACAQTGTVDFTTTQMVLCFVI